MPDSPKFPRFTALSIATSVVVLVTVLGPLTSPTGGLEGLAQGIVAIFVAALGVFLTIVWGLLACARREHWGGRISTAGVLLPIAVFSGIAFMKQRQEIAGEHSRMWHSIENIFVQPDGKLLLLGNGLLRLLPDGQPDPSFHRDYSFAHRGSLPGPVPKRLYWPEQGCAAMAPNGDLLLALEGWIGRVRPDGSDAPDLLNRHREDQCWGLAVQSDGRIVVAWDSPDKSPIVRLLPDGQVDPSFHTSVAPVHGFYRDWWSAHPRISVLGDGKIMVTGPVVAADDGCIRALLRLNSDGSVDDGFRFRPDCQPANRVDFPDVLAVFPNGSALLHMRTGRPADRTFVGPDGKEIAVPIQSGALPDALISDIALLPDGGMLVATWNWLGKFRPDGTPDPAFRAPSTFHELRRIVLQGEKILLSEGAGTLIRLNADGSPDPSFQMPSLRVYSD